MFNWQDHIAWDGNHVTDSYSQHMSFCKPTNRFCKHCHLRLFYDEVDKNDYANWHTEKGWYLKKELPEDWTDGNTLIFWECPAFITNKDGEMAERYGKGIGPVYESHEPEDFLVTMARKRLNPSLLEER